MKIMGDIILTSIVLWKIMVFFFLKLLGWSGATYMYRTWIILWNFWPLQLVAWDGPMQYFTGKHEQEETTDIEL